MEEYISLQNQDFTFIGKQTSLEGEFNFFGTTHIAGSIKGTIKVISNHELVVTHTGKIEGDVFCQDLNVYGTINGNITSKKTVKIFPTACVTGQIGAKNLCIYPGARINVEGNTENEEPLAN